MPSTYCFVGPSLPDAAELLAGTDIHLMPPVAAGDLLRLDVHAGDVVAIIDGFFHQTRSVRHKEILDLLARGVRVLGASSMGALRAAELDRFGMEGIGQIYADYRDGRLEADDEVTLLHSPAEEDYRAHSEPLVCIRATLAAAVRDGICGTAITDRIIDVLARRPFGLRSYGALLEAGTLAGLDETVVRSLRNYCTTHRQDPKRDDAILLVDQLRKDDAGDRPENPPVPRTVHRTAFLYAWQLVARTTSAERESTPVSTLDLLRVCQLFAQDYPEHHRAMVLRTLASRCAMECGGKAGSGTDQERALSHGEHYGLYELPARRERLGFLATWLSPTEAEQPLAEQLTTALVRSCRVALRLPWEDIALDLLQETEAVVQDAARFVSQAEDVNDRALRDRPDLTLDVLPKARIVDLLSEYWRTPADALELAALDRGFVSLDNAVSAARVFYLFTRYNDVTGMIRISDAESSRRQ